MMRDTRMRVRGKEHYPGDICPDPPIARHGYKLLRTEDSQQLSNRLRGPLNTHRSGTHMGDTGCDQYNATVKCIAFDDPDEVT